MVFPFIEPLEFLLNTKEKLRIEGLYCQGVARTVASASLPLNLSTAVVTGKSNEVPLYRPK